MRRDVVVDERERLTAQVLHVLERACLEVVDADDPVPGGEEGVAQVRTEKACASCDDGGRHPGRCYRGPGKAAPAFTKDLRPHEPLASRDALVATARAAGRDPSGDPPRGICRRGLPPAWDAGLRPLSA